MPSATIRRIFLFLSIFIIQCSSSFLYPCFPPSMIPNGHTCLNHQIKNRETIRSPGHYNPPQKLVYTGGTNVRFGSFAVLRLNFNCLEGEKKAVVTTASGYSLKSRVGFGLLSIKFFHRIFEK